MAGDEVRRQLEAIARRLDALDEKLDRALQTLAVHAERLGAGARRFNEVTERLNRLEDDARRVVRMEGVLNGVRQHQRTQTPWVQIAVQGATLLLVLLSLLFSLRGGA